MIADEKLALEIARAWVAQVRDRFRATSSREWLEQAIRNELRNGSSLTFVIKAVEAAEQGDEIPDAALREVGAELMEQHSGHIGKGQILAYLQRAALRAPYGRRPGRVWYDDYQRNVGFCVLIKLASRVFGLHATRSQESRRPGRPQSGVSLIHEALVLNGIHIEEKTIQKHIWFGYIGILVRTHDHPMMPEFLRQWSQAIPLLQDLRLR